MKCIECGKGRMRRVVASVPHQIRGLSFTVESKVLVCARCGFQMIPSDLLAEHARLTDEAYRHAAGLLSPEAIHAARQSLGLSQSEFAEYLGVGEASVKRWELGALQDKSSDDLIRLKTDPAHAQTNLEQLCARLGKESPTMQQRAVVFIAAPAGFQPLASWTAAPSGQSAFLESDALSVSLLTSTVN